MGNIYYNINSAVSMSEESQPDNISSTKSFGKDVGKLVSGTIVTAIIGFLLLPIITRIFNPDIYGTFSIFISIVGVFSVIACMRYEMAIVLPRKDIDAGAILLGCCISLFGVSGIALLIIILFGSEISTLLNAPEIAAYLIFVPLAIFIDGLYQALRYWNTRKMRFGVQATTQILQSLSGSGLKVSFGFIGWINTGSLIAGQLIGNGLGVLVILSTILKNDLHLLKDSCNRKLIRQQLTRYKKFPLIDMWATLLNVLSWNLPIILLSMFFSTTITGLYALGFTILQIPMGLIGGSIGQVYFQRGAIAHKEGKLGNLLEDIIELLALITFLPLCFIMVLGGDIFGLVFGEEWIEAGIYCQILAVWGIIWFITTSTSTTTLSIVEKQELYLRFTILNLITRIAALLIGGWYQNIYLALCLFVIFGLITYGYLLYLMFSQSKASIKTVILHTWTYLITLIMIGIGFSVLNYLFNMNIIIIIIVGLIVSLTYYYLLYRSNEKIRAYLPI